MKRVQTDRTGKVMTIIFNNPTVPDTLAKIVEEHKCSRADVIEVLLRSFYTSQEFSKHLGAWLIEKREIKNKILQANVEKRAESKKLINLLKNSPELMERLKKELEKDLEK
jgi:hypothetical protein